LRQDGGRVAVNITAPNRHTLSITLVGVEFYGMENFRGTLNDINPNQLQFFKKIFSNHKKFVTALLKVCS
jgi:hypothetical protein